MQVLHTEQLMLGAGVLARSCDYYTLYPLRSLFMRQFVEILTCDMLQTGVGEFATGGQVEVL